MEDIFDMVFILNFILLKYNMEDIFDMVFILNFILLKYKIGHSRLIR